MFFFKPIIYELHHYIVAIRFIWSCLRDIIRFAFCHLFDCSEKVSTNIYISCKSNLRIFFLEEKNRKETINIIVGSCAFRSVNQDSKMDNRNDAKSAMNAIFGAIDDEIPLFYSQLLHTVFWIMATFHRRKSRQREWISIICKSIDPWNFHVNEDEFIVELSLEIRGFVA